MDNYTFLGTAGKAHIFAHIVTDAEKLSAYAFDIYKGTVLNNNKYDFVMVYNIFKLNNECNIMVIHRHESLINLYLKDAKYLHNMFKGFLDSFTNRKKMIEINFDSSGNSFLNTYNDIQKICNIVKKYNICYAITSITCAYEKNNNLFFCDFNEAVCD